MPPTRRPPQAAPTAALRRRSVPGRPASRKALIVAIDGPAGSGKSTVARGVGRALGVLYLDTGAMYRAVTWRALKEGVDPSDGAALASLARRMRFDFGAGGLLVDGRAPGREIRSPRVGRSVSVVAAQPELRRELVRRQRALARGRSAVLEGRDVGTVVFPRAQVKVFLTASPGERARRRHRELVDAGIDVSLSALGKEIARRDALDASRAASPLAAAADAHVIDSTKRTPRQVIAAIVRLAQAARQGGQPARRPASGHE